MKRKTKYRMICFVMLIVAVVFVFFALAAPNLGSTIYIGGYSFGAEQWRLCYKVYLVVMIILFISSFFVKDKK